MVGVRNPLRWLAAALAIATLLAVACSPRDESATPGTTETPGSATAEATSTPGADETPEPSDIPAPLAAILAEIAAGRGLDAPPTLNAEIVARADVATLLDELTTEDDREAYRQVTTLYRLLGHFDLNQDYEGIFDTFGTEAVLGLYSPARETLWVVSDSGSLDDLSQRERLTLAHELVHVLQDYHFDLNAVYETIAGNLDRELAWTAVVEGDAEVHESEYSGGSGIRMGSSVLLLRGEPAQIAGIPPSFIREMFFPYQSGSIFARTVLREHGIEMLNELTAEPPGGTSLILHPERVDTDWAPREVNLPNITAALGTGWGRESGGTLGEFRWMNYLQMELTGVISADAAEGWEGDAYDVYVNGDESVAIFRVGFEDAAEADVFRLAHSSFLEETMSDLRINGELLVAERPNGVVTVVLDEGSGADVVIAIGSSADVAVLAMRSLLDG